MQKPVLGTVFCNKFDLAAMLSAMERCAQCGFDPSRWRGHDEASLFRALPRFWDDEKLLALVEAQQVHETIHRLMELAVPLGQEGEVVQINASGGGVPKLPLDEGRVDHTGLVGDVQFDTKHHGRQFQALSLWSLDVIEELQRAGHPIAPGSAGENVTVAGIDWSAMRPGTTVLLGEVVAEVSFPATPCKKQTGWFSDGDFRRIDHDRNPQWTRWYAWVRRPGVVRPGDPVR